MGFTRRQFTGAVGRVRLDEQERCIGWIEPEEIYDEEFWWDEEGRHELF